MFPPFSIKMKFVIHLHMLKINFICLSVLHLLGQQALNHRDNGVYILNLQYLFDSEVIWYLHLH